jgi:hypothetical protein
MDTNSARRTQLLASGLLIVVFAVGCLVGAATDRVLNAREPNEPVSSAAKSQAKRRDGKPHGSMIDARMLSEIALTSAQRLVIDSILDIREREAKKLWREWVPRFNAMMEQTRGQVRAQLTADQIKQLDELIEEHRAQRKQNHKTPQQQDDPDENKTDRPNPPPGPEEREPAPRRLSNRLHSTD